MKAKYSLTDLGPANWLLGIKITRNLEASTIVLSQLSYIESILRQFNFTDLKLFSTPIDPSICLSKDQYPQTPEEVVDMQKILYGKAIGSLNYFAVVTWSDMAFSIPLLAQFMDNPRRVHWEAIKQVFPYLLGTKHWKLTYRITNDRLQGYTDPDGSLQEHRHAISGYTFLVNGGAISWLSKKQELVTLSTAKSEYVATTYTAKEAIWLRCIISEVFEPVTELTVENVQVRILVYIFYCFIFCLFPYRLRHVLHKRSRIWMHIFILSVSTLISQVETWVTFIYILFLNLIVT